MATKRIYISLSDDLLIEVDDAVAKDYTTRSAYIREALMLRMGVDSYVEAQVDNGSTKVNLIRRANNEIRMHRRYNKMKPEIDWRD